MGLAEIRTLWALPKFAFCGPCRNSHLVGLAEIRILWALPKNSHLFKFRLRCSRERALLIRRYSFAVIAPNEDDFQKERESRRTTFRGANFSGNKRLGQLSSSAARLSLSLKTFHRQPRRDPVSVEFVLFEFTDIPAVLAVDADKISSRFYYVVDGETYLG